MITPEILKVLETAPLLQGVPRMLLIQQLNEPVLHHLKAGEMLLVPGQANSTVYIILSGRISIKTDLSEDPVAMLGEGECAGETSVIGDAYVPAYYIAATDCRLLAIDYAVMWQIIDSSHQAAHNVLSVLSTRFLPASRTLAQHVEYNDKFLDTSIIDEITGLYNRQWMEEKISRYLNRFALDNRPACLMMVSIDRFHELSEKYGELGRDQVLRDVAHTMLSCLRPDDQAGRFHDEKFVVFMPNTNLSDGCVAANRLRKNICASVIELASGDALPPVTITLGVCPVNLGDTPASLFARASEALHCALESGGNCVSS